MAGPCFAGALGSPCNGFGLSKKTVPQHGHRHYALLGNLRVRESGVRAPCDLGCAEACRHRILLAHVSAGSGLAIIAAPTAVVQVRCRIDPDDGVARAVCLGLGFARILAFVRRRGWTCRDRHAAALGHERALERTPCSRSSRCCIAWLSSARPSPIATKPVLPPMPHIKLRRRSVSSHIPPGKHRPTLTKASAAKNCRVGKLQTRGAALTGSSGMFSFCSEFVKTNREHGNKEKRRPRRAAVHGYRLCSV